MTGKAFPGIALGVLMVAATAQASSPDEWEKYQKEVSAACVKACGLKAALDGGGTGELSAFLGQ
jgi:hypothetical protein